MFEKKYKNKNNNKDEDENLKHVVLKFKFGPSSIFPVNSFNIDDYKYCFRYYRNNNINLSNYKWSSFYKINNDLSFINNDLSFNKLTSCISEIINLCECRIKYDLSNLKNILKNKSIPNKDINNFIDTHKFCTLEECNNFKKNELKEFIELFKNNIKIILSNIDNRSYYKNNINDYIVDNFDKWLLVMENNILIQNITELYSNDITCWDIQLIINTLNSLLLFNKDILKDNYYYNFELLFLLQSPYFYKENQLQKYHIIRNELKEENTELKVHQFMMGKGKTSVFTPLLSLCIIYLLKKQPTVITASHLVKDTKNYIKLSEFLLKININVFSDYEAKERWIKNYYPKLDKDKLYQKKFESVKKGSGKPESINDNLVENLSTEQIEIFNFVNLNNECNIIDEFDSHHNYLQSMFNYVRVMSSELEEDLFYYIFDYTYSKINKNAIIENNDINKNYPLLNDNLDLFYNISESMIYNMDYGFSFLYNYENNYERICSPFLRKDTPVKNSDFSSILLRLILTFKTYIIEFKSLLQDFDYTNLYNNIENIDYFYGINEELNNFIIEYELDSDNLENDISSIFKIK